MIVIDRHLRGLALDRERRRSSANVAKWLHRDMSVRSVRDLKATLMQI